MTSIEQIWNNYTPFGDYITIALCVAMLFLKKITYAKKDIRLKVFTWGINLLTITAIATLISYNVIKYNGVSIITYYLDAFCFLGNTLVFICYARYICEIFDIDDDRGWIMRRRMIIFPLTMIFIILILPLFSDILNKDITEIECIAANFLSVIYLYCSIMTIYIMIKYKKRFINKIWWAFISVSSISFLIGAIGFLSLNFTLFNFTFVLPLLAAYNLLHNNPYDIELGALDSNAFENYLNDLTDIKTEFTLVTLVTESISNKKLIKDVRTNFYNQHAEIFKTDYIFKLNDKRYVFVVKNGRINAEKRVKYLKELKAILDEATKKYNVEYKMTLLGSNETIASKKKYVEFSKYLEAKINCNTIYYALPQDYEDFIKTQYIKSQLHEIVKGNDLNDERVLVYCQPVYNTNKQVYDSAEALMRLKLPELGLVFPDQFISIAENEGYIHQLSLIILNKVCKKIKEYRENEISIERISVNFSIMELRQDEFCNDIIKIINDNDVEFNKIAIELTETRNEQDFKNIKNKIAKLKDIGMHFYLDDFGAGYSNFDRIMQLPVDIIKFDRSLVIMSGEDNNYKYMIKNFSRTFDELGYKILFEGVETKEDEDMCINMYANYLQGYKYSKPVPIEELKNFL